MLCGAVRAAAAAPILFVVPARKPAVRFAQDIARLRSSFIISYQNAAGAAAPLLHVWDGQGRRWIRIDIAQYRAGALFASAPSVAVLMGTEAELPGALRSSRSWTARDLRLPTFNMAENVNACDRFCRFTPREWRWLAGRYNFQLEDRNAERRRYGRYGRPGEPPRRPMPGPGASDDAPGAGETLEPRPLPDANGAVVAEEPAWDSDAGIVELPAPDTTATDPAAEPVPDNTTPTEETDEDVSTAEPADAGTPDVAVPSWTPAPREPTRSRTIIDPGSK